MGGQLRSSIICGPDADAMKIYHPEMSFWVFFLNLANSLPHKVFRVCEELGRISKYNDASGQLRRKSKRI